MKRKRGFLSTVTIALLLSILLAGCGECQKDIRVFGMVTDRSFTPLTGVEVYNVNTLLAKTGADGTYSYTFKKQFGIQGTQLTFVKTGYTSFVAPPLTKAEIGPEFCGDVSVKRDAVLE